MYLLSKGQVLSQSHTKQLPMSSYDKTHAQEFDAIHNGDVIIRGHFTQSLHVGDKRESNETGD